MSKIVELRNEEKKLRLTITALKTKAEDWEESKELAKILKEVSKAKLELDKARTILSEVKKESKRVSMETKKVLRTLDDKSVYLDELLPNGRSSTLVGKIEGDSFVWHKPYLEMTHKI